VQKSKQENVLTQSAASLLTAPTRYASGCAPVDALLKGGLTRGHILEISGPPGSCKEKLAVRFVKSFLERGEEVVFVGMCHLRCMLLTVESRHRLSEHDDCWSTRQSPRRFIPLVLVQLLVLNHFCAGFPSVPTNYRRMIRYVSILDPSEIMIFMHNLSSYIEQNPKVNSSFVTSAVVLLIQRSRPSSSSIPSPFPFSCRRCRMQQKRTSLSRSRRYSHWSALPNSSPFV
jgi:hypothetical protein